MLSTIINYMLTIPFLLACAHNTIVYNTMVHVHLSLVTATEALVTIMFISECTVAAAYNLLMQVLPTIENVWGNFWGGHILLVYSWIEVFLFKHSGI